MKKLLTFLIVMIFGLVCLLAQNPTLSYQSVVRDENNRLVQNTSINLTVQIFEGDVQKYQETRTVTTNQNGVVSFAIGDANRLTNEEELTNIVSWNGATIKVTYHLTSGDMVVDNPVTAVPFALQAANSLAEETDPVFTTWDKDYNDLINTPEIPTVNNATLTIKQGENTLGTFTANANEAVNVSIPEPAAQVQADWNATEGVAAIANKPSLDDYATKAGNNTFSGTNTFSSTITVPQAVNQNTLAYTNDEMQAVTYKDLIFLYDSILRRYNNIVDSLKDRISTLEEEVFPPFTCGATIRDNENNVYNTVKIGTQCWMKENLRTTQTPDGTEIEHEEAFYSQTLDMAYYYPGDEADSVEIYGLLYNYVAATNNYASGNRGICPEGWHLPTDEEWATLNAYVSNLTAAGPVPMMQAPRGWDYYAEWGPSNETGFSAVPAGGTNSIDPMEETPEWFGFGKWAMFHSSDDEGDESTEVKLLYHDRLDIYTETIGKYHGASIRCIHNEEW